MPARLSRSRPLADWPDDRLVEGCLGGRQDAWDELVERYGGLVYSVARRAGVGDADAEEVFQNVFLIACRKLATLRDPERLAAWLIRTTARETGRLGVRAGRTRALENGPEEPGAASDEDAAAWERQHLVRQALRRLGGRCEALLVALFLAPGAPNYQTIARNLGMKMGSIGPTRARCFRKLEKILAEMGLDPP